jgi:hypothetical protein
VASLHNKVSTPTASRAVAKLKNDLDKKEKMGHPNLFINKPNQCGYENFRPFLLCVKKRLGSAILKITKSFSYNIICCVVQLFELPASMSEP